MREEAGKEEEKADYILNDDISAKWCEVGGTYLRQMFNFTIKLLNLSNNL